MERRHILLGVATLMGFPGCISSQDPPSDSPATTASDNHTTVSKPVPESKGPVRGEHDVEISVRVVESDEGVEYLPENDSVRFVARRSGDEAMYETSEWAAWAEMQCASAARDPAIDHASKQLGASIGGSVGDGQVYTRIVTTVGQDGEITHRPEVKFKALVTATPRTVNATYILDDREQTNAIPVYAEHVVRRML